MSSHNSYAEIDFLLEEGLVRAQGLEQNIGWYVHVGRFITSCVVMEQDREVLDYHDHFLLSS